MQALNFPKFSFRFKNSENKVSIFDTIRKNTFDQIAQYNLTLNASYLMVTNGLNHYYCEMDFENERYNFLKDIPEYK